MAGYCNLSFALPSSREYAEAACEFEPEGASYHCIRGRVLRELGLTEKAALALEEALRLEPENMDAKQLMSRLRTKSRR